jgi:hypothetical protein
VEGCRELLIFEALTIYKIIYSVLRSLLGLAYSVDVPTAKILHSNGPAACIPKLNPNNPLAVEFCRLETPRWKQFSQHAECVVNDFGGNAAVRANGYVVFTGHFDGMFQVGDDVFGGRLVSVVKIRRDVDPGDAAFIGDCA